MLFIPLPPDSAIDRWYDIGDDDDISIGIIFVCIFKPH